MIALSYIVMYHSKEMACKMLSYPPSLLKICSINSVGFSSGRCWGNVVQYMYRERRNHNVDRLELMLDFFRF